MKTSRNWKILQVGKFYPPHRGGMETHLKNVCDNLREHASVEVLVAHGRRRTVEEVVDQVPVTRLSTPATVAGTSLCPEMVARIRQSKAHLIHIHLPNPMAIVAYLASGHRAKVVFSYHSDVVRQKILNTAFEPVLRRALNRSSAILVASPNYLKSSATLRHFRDRCHLVPYGIPRLDNPSASEVDRLKQMYGPRMILCVGRLVYYKGFEFAVRAMKDVSGCLCIVGTGPLKESLEKLALEIGVAERVRFLGDVDEDGLQALYHAADVFMLPSVARSEAFGIVQAEAMAAGKPVINTQLDSGVPYVSIHGVTGLTVPPADGSALGSALRTILDDPAICSRFGSAARARVENEFSIPVMMSRLLRIYEGVLHGTDGDTLAMPPTRQRDVPSAQSALSAG